MPVQKGLLSFTRVAAHEVFAGILGPHAEKLDRHLLAGDDGRGSAPVYLGLLATLRLQGDKGRRHLHPQTHLGLADIMAYRGIATLKIQFPNQTVINPFGCMPLLLGPALIVCQPLIDYLEIRAQNRIGLFSPGGIAKGLAPEDLSYRLPGMTGFPADLLDALLIDPVRRADIPILIHPDHPLHL